MTQAHDSISTAGEATAMQKTAEEFDVLAQQIQIAKQCIEDGDLEGGLNAFRRIAEEKGDVPEVFNNLGAICAALGNYDEAEGAFSRALELTPGTANPWYNRGLMRFQTGKYLTALHDFQKAAEIDPTDAEFRNNQGVALFQLQDWDAAREAFRSALELRGDYVAAKLNLIDVDLAEGKFAEAHVACKETLETSPNDEVRQKLIECTIQRAASCLDEARDHCEALQASVGENDDVLEQSNRVLNAKRALLGEDPPSEAAFDPLTI